MFPLNFTVADDELEAEEYNPWDDWEEQLDAALQECGYDPDTGICLKAGSEECEFECPLRAIYFEEDNQCSE